MDLWLLGGAGSRGGGGPPGPRDAPGPSGRNLRSAPSGRPGHVAMPRWRAAPRFSDPWFRARRGAKPRP
eukprot:5579199-Alexandrium_andersonii.AAC.1